jgi:hypothetical protein
MDYTTILLPSGANLVPETVIMTSLYETFQQLGDARRDQGKRYELALILCLLVLAKMAGQTSLSAATEWIRHRAAVLAERFGLRRQRMPCQMMYCNVLARVDAKHLDEILQAFFVRWEAEPRCGTEPSRLHTPRPGTKDMGALPHRHITCSPDLNDWFARDWQGLEQVFRLERTRLMLKTGVLEHEVVYGLSSLSMRQASPERMLSFVRDHWAIENKLHYRRDGSLGEDACQTRTGPVPHLLAQLNSTVLSLMDRAGVRNVARQMRYFDAHPEQALALVLTGSCVVY